MQEHKKRHLAVLDGVRGLAILLVLVFHSTIQIHLAQPVHLVKKLYQDAASVGWCGVDLFFVLSGFLIAGILLDNRERNRYFLNFYMRRVLRIFPLFYGTLLVFFFLCGPLLCGTQLLPQFHWLRAHQGWSYAYIQNWLFMLTKWPPNMLGHFWSLAIEEQFYIFWPLIVFVTSPPDSRVSAWC